MKKIYLILLILLFGATIVSHDLFCHEHLHEISSPLHSLFDNPAPIEASAFIGSPPPEITLAIQKDKILLYDYVKNIFHPPDFLS